MDELESTVANARKRYGKAMVETVQAEVQISFGIGPGNNNLGIESALRNLNQQFRSYLLAITNLTEFIRMRVQQLDEELNAAGCSDRDREEKGLSIVSLKAKLFNLQRENSSLIERHELLCANLSIRTSRDSNATGVSTVRPATITNPTGAGTVRPDTNATGAGTVRTDTNATGTATVRPDTNAAQPHAQPRDEQGDVASNTRRGDETNLSAEEAAGPDVDGTSSSA